MTLANLPKKQYHKNRALSCPVDTTSRTVELTDYNYHVFQISLPVAEYSSFLFEKL